MELNIRLLDDFAGSIVSPVDLNACLNAHGLYNSIQCVLRLSPEVHRRIAAIPKGIVPGGLDVDDLQAYSTYLHETIHWWQHIGSTAGLMLSLSYPGQAHANYLHLKRLVERIGPKKSILRWVEVKTLPGGDPETPAGIANTIVNNYFDIEFFRVLVTSPRLVQQVVEHRLFDCVGHSYDVAYGNILLTLNATIEEDFSTTDDPREWEKEFATLRLRRATGYYRGSAVTVSPIGGHQIFEGQARFAQLQFLYFALGRRLTWEEIRAKGMLIGIYGEAFDTFLKLAGLDWPRSVDDPVVALFLLVCDIAINPGAGFPLPLRAFTTFIEDVDPGIRFLFLCRTIATKRPDLATAITRYSREEYVEVSEALAVPLMIDPPTAVAETVSRWARDSQGIRSLLAEYQTFAYVPRNLPVRLLFSHFVAFSSDKCVKPEFFCWPGAWMVGERVSAEIVTLFDRHSAPFLDKPEDAGIYPRAMSDKDEATVQDAFNSFYAANVTYDMTRQWIVTPGPFQYDYRSLSSFGTESEFKEFGDRHFEMVYGVHPDAFELI